MSGLSRRVNCYQEEIAVDVEGFLSCLEGVKRSGSDQYMALCPAHEDRKPSLSIGLGDDDRILIHCHAGCETSDVLDALGMTFRDLRPDNVEGSNGEHIIYTYTDEKGRVLFYVERFPGKEFRQCRHARSDDDPSRVKDGFVWSLKYSDGTTVRRVPYRLEKIIEGVSEGICILVVEGEKDVDTLDSQQYYATCNPGGAGRWRDKYSGFFEGADVVVVPDNDDPGRKHAIQVANSLTGHASNIRVLELPKELNGEPVKDCTDFFEAGGTNVQFEELWDDATSAESWFQSMGLQASQTDDSPRPLADNRPYLQTDDKDLKSITNATWRVIEGANQPEPVLFRMGGVPARVESDDSGRPVVRVMDKHAMRGHLARIARWGKWVKDDLEQLQFVDAYPPDKVVETILSDPITQLPILERVTRAPVFTRDGSLTEKPGYFEGSHLLYRPMDALALWDERVPENPNARDIAIAKRVLIEDLLGDFPLVSESDVAHAVAVVLLPFARNLIDGPTPLHLVEKPSPGTGASLMVFAITSVTSGSPAASITEGRHEDEWRKRLTAKLMTGPNVVVIDNLRRRLDSAALSSAITANTWEDRLLGVSQMVTAPVQCMWLATGNNPLLSNEMARRSIRIRMDAKTDRPWKRDGFRYPDLMGTIEEHRSAFVYSCLVLIKAWLAAGRPAGTKKLGMFESWARVIGGIFDVAGIPGFLDNLEELYERADAEGNQWRAFTAAWWESFESDEVGVAQLFEMAEDIFDLGRGSEKAQRTKLGRILGTVEDRVFGNFKIRRGRTRQGATLWRLDPIGEVESST